MQEEIAIFMAKNKLSELVQLAQREGREFLITVRGKPAAKLSPVDDNQPSLGEIRQALDRLQAWGKKHPLILYEGETLKDLVEYGRR